MSTTSDPRFVPGNVVSCRATLITAHADCKRLFGSAWKTKLVTGPVTEAITTVVNGRDQRQISADWNLQGRIKSKIVKISKVKVHSPSKVAEEDSPPSAEILSDAQPLTEEVESIEVSPVTEITEREVIRNQPAASAHSRDWLVKEVLYPLNGTVPCKTWKVIGQIGDVLIYGNAPQDYTLYNFSLYTFPLKHLHVIVRLTNCGLELEHRQLTSPGEILKRFGVLTLMTKFSFGNRRDLWRTESTSKYIPAADFGAFMSRSRFECLLRNIKYSSVNELSDETNSVSRWAVVKGFLNAINEHREKYVCPSKYVCVDESMSRWLGLGGDWTTVGLPHYVALDRKPENGCEIWTAACGESGIMLRLEIMTVSTDHGKKAFEDEASAAATLRLVKPWLRSHTVVCGDSWFWLVTTTKALLRSNIRFIGVVKNASSEYPMNYLAGLEMPSRGQHVSMVSQRDGEADLMAVMWLDRERKYFVSSCSVTSPGETITRERWRTEGESTKKIEFQVKIPEVAEIYYKTCSQVDRHNRCRQDDFGLEKSFQVKEWSRRLNTTLLSICIVDAWLLYKHSMGPRCCMNQATFYERLAEGLIDDKYDNVASTRQDHREIFVLPEKLQVNGIGLHLTPTNRKRKRSNGSVSNAAYQARCKICKNNNKSKFISSGSCDKKRKSIFLCHSDTGRSCFGFHLRDVHHIDEF